MRYLLIVHAHTNRLKKLQCVRFMSLLKYSILYIVVNKFRALNDTPARWKTSFLPMDMLFNRTRMFHALICTHPYSGRVQNRNFFERHVIKCEYSDTCSMHAFYFALILLFRESLNCLKMTERR